MHLVPGVLLGLTLALPCLADETPSAEEQKAITAVESAGGKAVIDSRLVSGSRVSASFAAANDMVLQAVAKHPPVGALEVDDATRCSAKGFTGLKDLPRLRKLVVRNGNLTPAAVTAVSQCKELRYLALIDAGLTDTELMPLKKLNLLEHLTLANNPKITDKGMQTVKSFERLRALDLTNTSIGDRGLWELKGLDGLRTLSVAKTGVTADAAEKFVDEMPNLRKARR